MGGKIWHEEKKRTARRAPGDNVLPDQFQTVAAVLASDWWQKNTSFLALSPGALLVVLLLFFAPHFSARLDFPSSPLSAPGSPRMARRVIWPLRDWRARLDSLYIKTRTRRAWKGFWLVCFSRFQELFLLELISCWVEIPKGWTNVVYFSVKFAENCELPKY